MSQENNNLTQNTALKLIPFKKGTESKKNSNRIDLTENCSVLDSNQSPDENNILELLEDKLARLEFFLEDIKNYH